jgi:hypothetical protein
MQSFPRAVLVRFSSCAWPWKIWVDLGRVIGRQGQTAKAPDYSIRSRYAHCRKVALEIIEGNSRLVIFAKSGSLAGADALMLGRFDKTQTRSTGCAIERGFG